ncbi:hypothetical protein HanRHA438_Chr04g0174541 [Helianthus annuus]|nr:hypothetical protein HanRHA438_Chr04g0174541 [Helianthus annuus]
MLACDPGVIQSRSKLFKLYYLVLNLKLPVAREPLHNSDHHHLEKTQPNAQQCHHGGPQFYS